MEKSKRMLQGEETFIPWSPKRVFFLFKHYNLLLGDTKKLSEQNEF